jgi:hypothetical protein
MVVGWLFLMLVAFVFGAALWIVTRYFGDRREARGFDVLPPDDTRKGK